MVLHTNCLHNGVSYEFLVCDGFFIYIVSFKNIFNMKRGYVYAWGWGHVKMCYFFMYIVALKLSLV